MNDKYILEGKTPKLCSNLFEWGQWFENNLQGRRVARDIIGKTKVSTVFLGLDHSFGGGPPVLFETMIFGGEHDEDMWRYNTWEQAETGHAKAVQLVKEAE